MRILKGPRPRDNKWVGRTELLNGGRQEMGINVREIELPKEGSPGSDSSGSCLQTRKWPGLISRELGAEYFFRPDKNISYFHVKTGSQDEVVLASTQPSCLETKTIENALHETTRGFAVQILFEGRGVRAHLEPAWPHLKIRLGVGGNLRDFTWLCERDPEVKGYLQEKNGTILVLHGPTKARVSRIAMGVTLSSKANAYSGKGAHFAFNPVRRRTPKKKKKGVK
jgi:ribosomal protein L6P/L9E